jgi:NAD(P)-dependent dehydrogenase (short-subunit alcohol dehydrogenase family)
MNIVVIGAGPGIGSAVARRFARAGFGVGLIARTAATLERALAEVGGAAESATEGPADAAAEATTDVPLAAEQGDAGSPSSLTTALDRIERVLGPIDVLHYNAVRAANGPGSTLDPRVFLDSLAVNVGGALVAAQWANARMSARGGGTILFTGGGLAFEAWPSFTALSAGKTAIRSLAQALHKELTPTGVRVGMVSVMGTVGPGGPYDPEAIAEEFWDLCSTPTAEWKWELRFRGRNP